MCIYMYVYVHVHTVMCSTENKRKAVVVKLLQSRGYPSDPVKTWKHSVSDEEEEEAEGEGEGEEEGERGEGEADYNYLLSMSIWSLTLEKKEELLKKRDEKVRDYSSTMCIVYMSACSSLLGHGVKETAGQDAEILVG